MAADQGLTHVAAQFEGQEEAPRKTMDKNDVHAAIAESLKLGTVSSSDWQSYTWKNKLAEQKCRILQHLAEAIADTQTEQNPHHMHERAVGVAAVCMRRLIECRVVTDSFRDSLLPFTTSA